MNLNKFKQLWYSKDLRQDILFVIFILFIFRLLAHIPVPGINPIGLKDFLRGNQILGLLNMFTGGGLERFSVVMLGIGPYITASIIFQLLTMLVPKIEEMQKEGERGQAKINQWTRYLTIPLAVLQSYMTIMFLNRSGQGGVHLLSSFTPLQLITAVATITAGTVFLMWLGELISERKIGNGISIIIFAGIVADLPRGVLQGWSDLQANPGALTHYLVFLVIALITVAAVVFITEGTRNIPVSYARQTIGSRIYGSPATHLPLRVNPVGMIPIIFAVSVMLFPSALAQFFAQARTPWLADAARFTMDLFKNQIFYSVLYFLLVVAFTYFYTAIVFQPQQIAENLQKQGGFIPGIRPGRETAVYLSNIMNRIVFAGALFLGVIASLPFVMKNFGGFNVVIGGSSLIIVVGVVIDIIQQIDSQLIMRDYEGL